MLILSNGATGGIPGFGGFLFLPAHGSPNLHLLSFNVISLATGGCGHAHRAEMQILEWPRHQTETAWQRGVSNIAVGTARRVSNIAVAQLPQIQPPGQPRRFLGYSVCNFCCEELTSRLSVLNASRPADDHILARGGGPIRTRGRASCGDPTTRSGVEMLRTAGWKIQGPLPPEDPGSSAARHGQGRAQARRPRLAPA